MMQASLADAAGARHCPSKGLSFHITRIVHGPLQVRSQFRPFFWLGKTLTVHGIDQVCFRMFPWSHFF